MDENEGRFLLFWNAFTPPPLTPPVKTLLLEASAKLPLVVDNIISSCFSRSLSLSLSSRALYARTVSYLRQKVSPQTTKKKEESSKKKCEHPKHEIRGSYLSGAFLSSFRKDILSKNTHARTDTHKTLSRRSRRRRKENSSSFPSPFVRLVVASRTYKREREKRRKFLSSHIKRYFQFFPGKRRTTGRA